MKVRSVNMPFTREQVCDIKIIIKETISELLVDDKFISTIVEKVQQKLNVKETQQKVQTLEYDMKVLKDDNKKLRGDIENLQQHIKRKSIRIYGLSESNDENTQQKVLQVFSQKLKVNVAPDELENCFRIGGDQRGKRAVLVTFKQQNVKLKLIQGRKALKGTGITISEDMTSQKYSLLKMAKGRLGKENVWYYGGNVHVKIGQSKKIVKNIADID